MFVLLKNSLKVLPSKPEPWDWADTTIKCKQGKTEITKVYFMRVLERVES